jgi:hypothetical protein
MNLQDTRRNLAYRITSPVVRILSKSGVTPNALTLTNLALNIVAAYFIATGHFIVGGVWIRQLTVFPRRRPSPDFWFGMFPRNMPPQESYLFLLYWLVLSWSAI